MKRRDFLKLSLGGLAIVATPIAFWRVITGSPRIEAEAFGEVFQGTPTGQLLVSQDKGEKWQQAANFGESCPVLGLVAQDDELLIKLGYQGFEFYLKSRDGRVWRSLEA